MVQLWLGRLGVNAETQHQNNHCHSYCEFIDGSHECFLFKEWRLTGAGIPRAQIRREAFKVGVVKRNMLLRLIIVNLTLFCFKSWSAQGDNLRREKIGLAEFAGGPCLEVVSFNPSILARRWSLSVRQSFHVYTEMATGISSFSSANTPCTKTVSVSEKSHCRTPKQSEIMSGLDPQMSTNVPESNGVPGLSFELTFEMNSLRISLAGNTRNQLSDTRAHDRTKVSRLT